MNKITDIFAQKDRTYSFELFPPKTDQGYENLKNTITKLAALKPDFFSCTYGAGGGSRDKTLDIVEFIEKEHHITAMAHLTCVLSSRNEIKAIIEDIQSRGVRNILALRGDPPQDQPDWQPGPENFRYASELCSFIREHFDQNFGIGVAGFPEGHILCKDRDKDAGFLKLKIDSGADFVITQLFFNNQDYYDYVKRLRNLGVTARVIPGIIAITNYQSLLRFTAMCGATVTDEVKEIFEPIQDDAEKVLQEGIHFAVRQCRDLLDNGAPGLHFYCLNKVSPVDQILEAVRV
ncbi:MAG: methylenetetrahydrofolate reductase [NAD(P)H] [Candidatus Omnitrophica bacterium]|nr:methylenetetrahydrofolate reductase [NAD(P)H] [Candidatus Omnitrophota bacterium]